VDEVRPRPHSAPDYKVTLPAAGVERKDKEREKRQRKGEKTKKGKKEQRRVPY
jgi:hypothetical protein